MKHLKKTDPDIFYAIKNEIERQENNLELIASENFTSLAVLEAQGSVLTNKYAEGYPNRRWYGGCEYVDLAETLAIERAKILFGAEHANVQAHSGTQANMAVYMAAVEPGDTVLAMDLACGGHLSHGHPHNFSGMFYKIVTYGVDKKTEMLDYDRIMDLAKIHKPKMILAGASAYPRHIDFERFRKIADGVGAYLMADIAHPAVYELLFYINQRNLKTRGGENLGNPGTHCSCTDYSDPVYIHIFLSSSVEPLVFPRLVIARNESA